VQVAPARELTAEERAERLRLQQEADERRKEEERKRRLADVKATKLLRQNLTREQLAALDKHGWFLVQGGKSEKTYRLHKSGRMEEMEGDAAIASFCVHADYNIPVPDQVLAKALCIRLDEEFIIKTANRTNLNPPLRRAA
jgi:hypothetical protein